FVAVIPCAIFVMAATPGDNEAKKQANEKVGKELGVPIFFGSLLLGFGLGYMRVLPGTRRPKPRTQEQLAGDALATWSPNRGVYHAGAEAGAHPQFNVTPALYTPPKKASAPRLQPPRAMDAQAASQAQPQQAASRESAIGSTHTFHLS